MGLENFHQVSKDTDSTKKESLPFERKKLENIEREEFLERIYSKGRICLFTHADQRFPGSLYQGWQGIPDKRLVGNMGNRFSVIVSTPHFSDDPEKVFRKEGIDAYVSVRPFTGNVGGTGQAYEVYYYNPFAGHKWSPDMRPGKSLSASIVLDQETSAVVMAAIGDDPSLIKDIFRKFLPEATAYMESKGLIADRKILIAPESGDGFEYSVPKSRYETPEIIAVKKEYIRGS